MQITVDLGEEIPRVRATVSTESVPRALQACDQLQSLLPVYPGWRNTDLRSKLGDIMRNYFVCVD